MNSLKKSVICSFKSTECKGFMFEWVKLPCFHTICNGCFNILSQKKNFECNICKMSHFTDDIEKINDYRNFELIKYSIPEEFFKHVSNEISLEILKSNFQIIFYHYYIPTQLTFIS